MGTAASRGIHVQRFEGVRGVRLFERQLDGLDRESRSPSLFSSFGFLASMIEHDERRAPGDEVALLAALDGDRLVGLLPLRRRVERTLGVRWKKLELVVSHDGDHPGVLARPEDEGRCASAFWRHLADVDGDWSQLELVNQEPASPFPAVLGAGAAGFLVKQEPGNPLAVVPLPFPDLAAYYRALPRKFRANTGRLGRRLLSAGSVELVTSAEPRAQERLFDLFLDVERRSWKHDLGIARHPARVARYRELFAPEPLREVVVELLLLDHLPIAGMVCASFAGQLLGLETAYDAAFQALGPGHLMMLLCMREALRRHAGSLNLLGSYGYYKASWGAELRETSTLNVFRVGSAPWARALAGRVKHSLLDAGEEPDPVRFNEDKRAAEQDAERPAEGWPPQREAERAHAVEVLGELRASGLALDRLAGAALRAELPFELSDRERP